MSNKQRAVFVDRDGTVIKEVEYLTDPKLIELLPGTNEGFSLLKKSGYLIIIITNQSVIGRGKLTHQELAVIHQVILDKLATKYDALYYCPHLPKDHCGCRKPSAGLILKAASDYNLDLRQCHVIGDRRMDIDLGKTIKAKRTILVRSTWSSIDGDPETFGADWIAKDFSEAAKYIIKEDKLA